MTLFLKRQCDQTLLQLADVFGQFGAELGQEECLALLSAIDVTDETTALTFDDFLKCMSVLVNA